MRTEVGRQLTPLRRELLELGEQRERHLRDLGAAVYDGDGEAAKRATDELSRLNEQRQQKETQIAAIAESAQERLDKGRMRVQPTVIKRPDDEA